MDKIEIQNKNLLIPEYSTIPVITGDATEKKVWKSARLITAEAIKKCYADKRGINWLEIYIDESNPLDQYESQTDAIVDTLITYNAGILLAFNQQIKSINPSSRFFSVSSICISV